MITTLLFLILTTFTFAQEKIPLEEASSPTHVRSLNQEIDKALRNLNYPQRETTDDIVCQDGWLMWIEVDENPGGSNRICTANVDHDLQICISLAGEGYRVFAHPGIAQSKEDALTQILERLQSCGDKS